MKHGKKLLLVFLLVALAVGIFPISAQAAEPQYQLRVYPGNKGTITGQSNGVPYSVSLPYGKSLTIPDVTTIEEYYVKGMKESGKDSFMPSYYVTQDQDFIVVYGLKGHEVRYVIRYLEYGSDTVLAQEQVFYADAGDKPISSYIYIENYQPYRRTTKTLVEDESQNVLYAYYTRLPAETTGGGGGNANAGNANAGNANAGNANAANNANANNNANAANNANADNNANAANNANADNNANAGNNANTDNNATPDNNANAGTNEQNEAVVPAPQPAYQETEDIMDLDVPLASFEDLFDSSDVSNDSGSASSDTQPAVITDSTDVEKPKPKTVPKWALISGLILFFCLISLLYWYLLFYRKKKKYADVEVISFADDGEPEDDFDIETYRKHGKDE